MRGGTRFVRQREGAHLEHELVGRVVADAQHKVDGRRRDGRPIGAGAAALAGPRSMKLGAAWNLFDCEELLEASVRSVRPAVDWMKVARQTPQRWAEIDSPGMALAL